MTHKRCSNIIICQDSVFDIMLELVRAAVLDRGPIISKDISIDWDKMMDQASAQGTLAWVWDSICRLPEGQQPPRIQRINFGMSAQEIWDRYEQQNHLLNNLISTCSRNDMRLLLLKGVSLSQLYPKPKSRPCGDLDIFLFEDHDKFNKIFIDHVECESNHHTILRFKDTEEIIVENHFDFLNPQIIEGERIGKYLKSTLKDVMLTEQGYYMLSPLAGLVYLTSHTMKHLYNELFISMRNFVDFAMYLKSNRQELSPQDCFNLLNELKLGKGFEVILYMSEYILGLNFEEYHQNKIPSKYVSFLHQWITNDYSKPNMARSEELGLITFLKQRRKNRRIRRYMLKFKRDDIKVLRTDLSGFARAIFHIPSDETFKTNLRRKCRFNCN